MVDGEGGGGKEGGGDDVTYHVWVMAHKLLMVVQLSGFLETWKEVAQRNEKAKKMVVRAWEGLHKRRCALATFAFMRSGTQHY